MLNYALVYLMFCNVFAVSVLRRVHHGAGAGVRHLRHSQSTRNVRHVTTPIYGPSVVNVCIEGLPYFDANAAEHILTDTLFEYINQLLTKINLIAHSQILNTT